MLRTLLAAAAFALAANAAEAAPQAFALTIENGRLGGPGGEIIRAQLPAAQFVLWGEDHGFADSPLILRAIAREARPLGFKYHVVEVGPLSTAMVRHALTREGAGGVARLVHEVPMGLPFVGNREDAELASDFLGRDAKGQPYLIGVDQEFIGAPVFHLKRLVMLAPNAVARAEAERILTAEQDAAAKAAQDKFLMTTASDADFDKLADMFKGQTEALAIVAELKESAAIYQLWMHDHNYENNARRARLLAKNFLAAYHAAAEREPKMIFKMGIEHMALGTNTVNQVDLGTLATSIARTDGLTALRIAFLPGAGHNLAFAPQPGNPTKAVPYESDDAKEFFASIGLDPKMLPAGWSVIPMEPVRQTLDSRGIDKLKPLSKMMILGFDYIVTTPDAKPATFLYCAGAAGTLGPAAHC